ncbi:MAG: hypothetical protein H7289_07760 [Mucilaginibacter sp.]|nr:hypothetical protein [Mucilaginibacter sp.]
MTTFENTLKELQNEQKTLLASVDRRKKVVRQRINEITAEFYKVKAEWRQYNEANKIGIYAFV